MQQVIISLKPVYSELVLSGSKTVEIRNRVVRIEPPTTVWIYVKYPVGKIVALADVRQVTHGSPDTIWRNYQEEMCIDWAQFKDYVGNRNLVSAIVLQKLMILNDPVSIVSIRRIESGFHPPQFYSYIAPESGLFTILDTLRAKCTLRQPNRVANRHTI